MNSIINISQLLVLVLELRFQLLWKVPHILFTYTTCLLHCCSVHTQAMAQENTVCEPEPMDSEDPLFIVFSSGTLGTPKPYKHTQAGFLVHNSVIFKVPYNHGTQILKLTTWFVKKSKLLHWSFCPSLCCYFPIFPSMPLISTVEISSLLHLVLVGFPAIAFLCMVHFVLEGRQYCLGALPRTQIMVWALSSDQNL